MLGGLKTTILTKRPASSVVVLFGHHLFRAKLHPERPAGASRNPAVQIATKGPHSCALLTSPADVAGLWSIHLKFVQVILLGWAPTHINLPWRCSSLVTIFTNDATIYSSSSTVPFFPFLRSCFFTLLA